jgi:hypothetical protein
MSGPNLWRTTRVLHIQGRIVAFIEVSSIVCSTSWNRVAPGSMLWFSIPRNSSTAFTMREMDLGFSKFLYQHLLKYVRVIPTGHFYVFPDKRATRRDPRELREILNAGAFRRFGVD